MQAYREIIEGKRLIDIVDLPSELRDKEVEIIVLPVEESKKKRTKLSQNWAGALSDYRDQYTSIELQKKTLEWRGE
ncbi:MAG: hypothetical protein GY940_17120 [bacterium]|nr:hypothetical protein [bacterium]